MKRMIGHKAEWLFRSHVMSGSSDQLRGLLLNPAQVQLVQRVARAGTMTAARLRKDLDCSIQNASTKLTALHARGYLERVEDVALSGGREYIYSADVWGWAR